MLLAAIVSALVVAADSVVDSYADGHLLIGWIGLWAVGFAALALFAGSARNAAQKLSSAVGAWAQRRAQRKSDAYLLAVAQHDPRIMADIQAALGYTASMNEILPSPTAAPVAAVVVMTRRARRRADAALWKAAQHDPRIMAEIQAAIARASGASEAMDHALGRAWLGRHPVGTFNAAYAGPTRAFRASPMTGLPTHMQYLPG